MRKHLTTVLDYFAFFSYAPTLREIHTFYPESISKKSLSDLLSEGCTRGKLVRLPKNKVFGLFQQSILNLNLEFESSRYTLPQYSIRVKNKFKFQIQIQDKKPPQTIQIYLFILRYLLPFVRFVGVTGATAMSGYTPLDDIDLFIITKGGALWTSRLYTVLIAKALRIHGGTGVCLNMFFDEDGLSVPKMKQNKYIAHELLQMKPVIDKTNTYSLLMKANTWIFEFFPNALVKKIQAPNSNSKKGTTDWIPAFARMTQKTERLFRFMQLPIIKKNKTGFRITDHQLWLFKRDFEKKLKRNGLGR